MCIRDRPHIGFAKGRGERQFVSRGLAGLFCKWRAAYVDGKSNALPHKEKNCQCFSRLTDSKIASKSSVQLASSGKEIVSSVASKCCCCFGVYFFEFVRFNFEFSLNPYSHLPVKGCRLTARMSYSPTT